MRALYVDIGDKSAVSGWWGIGARVFAGSFDVVVECRTVDDLYNHINATHGITHAQVWGHGRPGAPLINGHPLDATLEVWRRLDRASVWFRACSVAQGATGRGFMRHLSQRDVSPVAHLCVTGTWGMHSHLVGIVAGEEPWWPAGLAPGPSTPLSPRTVPATQMKLPAWAFRRDT